MKVSTSNTTEYISDQSYIEIIICSPHQPVRKIVTKSNGQIKILQSLWPNSPKKFIFNGSQLNSDQTFDFYGIKNGDSILVLSDDHDDYMADQWLFVTRDTDSFNNQMNWMINPKTVHEASRIRDLHFLKLEQKPKLFRKICQPFLESFNESNYQEPTVISTEQPTEPSTEELPILWN